MAVAYFSQGGGGADDPLAGHPSRGLIALYKGDEYTGQVLNDATGNMPPITLASGVALNCTVNAQYISDGTGLTTAMNGQPAALSFCFTIKTPASTGSATTHYLVGQVGGGNPSPLKLYLVEGAYGSTRKFRIRTSIRATLNGGGATDYDLSLPTGAATIPGPGLTPETGYDVIGIITTTGSGPQLSLHIRPSGGEWFNTVVNNGSAGTYVFSSTVAMQILATNAGSPFAGMVQNVCVALGAQDAAMMKNLVERPTPTYIESALDGITARYWSFSPGAGDNAWERVTGALVAITGIKTWIGAQSWGYQYALRQGFPYYGKAGVRLGGEASFATQSGRSVSTGISAEVMASADGWTMVATLRTGTNVPVATMILCGFHGPNGDGTVSTDPLKLAGVNLALGTDGIIKARVSKRGGGTDDNTSSSVDVGAGGSYASNGLLTTYVISCDNTGLLTFRRVAIGDTSVTTITHAVSANLGFLAMRANAAGFGWASFDADCVSGFLAAHNAPLTDAEVMQAHRSAVARMRGQDIYVNGSTGLLGNGSEVAPYSTLHDAWRTMQPWQTVRVTGGTHARKTNLGVVSSPAIPSSSDHITIIGTGTPTFVSTETDAGKYPLELVSGHWTWSGFRSNAADDANNISTPTALDGYSNAVNASEDVDYVSFSDCAFDNAAKSEESNGTGFACRAKTVRVIDCTADGNEEHGVYLRRWVGETEDGAVTVDGLTCTIPAGGEDGLKITAEGAGGRLWRGSIRNLTVTGGRNQLNLKGFVGDVANVLLKDQESEQPLIAACYLGSDPAYTGETLYSDERFEGRVTNMTIVGANARALWVKGSNTTAELYNVLIKDTAGVDLEVDEDSPCTTSHCAGDAATGEWPDENGNIPGATITFVGATYVLDPASDGYGDGVNMTGIIEEAKLNLAGDTRPPTGAWNIGAY